MRSFSTLLLAIAFTTGVAFQSLAQCAVTSCPGLRTQTQGGWGAPAKGNNPGVYLNDNFAAAFPNGLTVGCTKTLTLTSAAAVRAFLPSGSTPVALTANVIDPTKQSLKNVFAGQVVALALSLRFDEHDANFGSSSVSLKDLVIAGGTFGGWTVQQLFDEANKKLGGCASSYSFSQLNNAVSSVNENYVDGNVTGNYLVCPITIDSDVAHVLCPDASNGSIDLTVSGGVPPYTFAWSNGATTEDLAGIGGGSYTVTVTDCIGLEQIQSFVVNEPAAFDVTAEPTQPLCNQPCTGSIVISVSGATAPYAFAWSNGATTQNIANLCAGGYFVTITDANGCEHIGGEYIITCIPTNCDTLYSYTQGGWGAEPHGNNPGVYLHNNFSDAFFFGDVTIGCAAGNSFSFTSAQSITDFLPSGGQPRALEFSATNPVNYGNTLAGQLLAATLNVWFDYIDTDFSPSNNNLGDYYFIGGTFHNMTVNEVIYFANEVIGGCSSEYTYSELNEALTIVNENYHAGTVDLGHLTCMLMGENLRKEATVLAAPSFNANVYPNPSNGSVSMDITAVTDGQVTVNVVDMMGRVVMSNKHTVTKGINRIALEINAGTNGFYTLVVTDGAHVSNKMLMIQK